MRYVQVTNTQHQDHVTDLYQSFSNCRLDGSDTDQQSLTDEKTAVRRTSYLAGATGLCACWFVVELNTAVRGMLVQ